jgi:hypothetical protein
MNHPTQEDWMAFLYAEDPPERRTELHSHLQKCPECARRLNDWRHSMTLLDSWPASAGRRITVNSWPLLKWAAAAALMLGIGFAIGRGVPRPPLDLNAIKAELAGDLQPRIAAAQSSHTEVQRVLTEFAKAQEEKHRLDRQILINALRQMDARYAANLAALRGELETVALNTQDGLIETHQQLGWLASSTQATNPAQK